MQLIKKPNRWSCLPASFAMAMGEPLEWLLVQIGHDGSEIIFPTLPEPVCRRGFHIQECIHVALNQGFRVTPYEIVPVIASADLKQTYVAGNRMEFFDRLIRARIGVITGRGRNTNHAVAFDRGTIYDPEGHVYEYSQENCLATSFTTQCAWLTS